ncbi:acyl-CoA synthetase [Iamia sp. SCSIO 61187]|uniref:acyl-CoA synthetase n=1 Tax=Iamia sp. SCSIO 61187 TaxID=2722752 RepID=UPI001C63ADEE|nr:acyl-CoA synthetase [Iamia sp. SCSIO 61187]QYG93370.1 acyl-CoA synthetase [Iamia sp. SCSIO 61187]
MPQEFTLAGVFDAVARAHPEREAIVFRDRRLSYGDLLDRSTRLAHVLADAGLGARSERDGLGGHESHLDHVGLYLYNGNEYVEGMIAGSAARVGMFNVNYRYVTEELLYLLRDSGATGLVYHARFAPLLAEIRDELPDLRVLVQVADETGAELLPGAVDYEGALAAASAEPLTDRTPSPDDLYILYTGGTTGMPKGVLWRQHDIYVGAMGGRPFGSSEVHPDLDAIVAAVPETGMRAALTPPLMHGAAQWLAFNTFTGGGAIIIPDDPSRLDAAGVWDQAEREKVNTLQLVGDAFARPLIDELTRRPRDLSSLFAVVNGGAPLTAALKERILELLPNIVVLDAVGSSETGAQMGQTSVRGAASTGTFTPGPDTVVVDESISRLLSPGEDEVGWLAQRGYVPLGYLGDADKTARTFPVIDGTRYAVPGDRARWREDGIIELLGRDSVTINSGGEKIFAEEVEMALAPHPSVADVVVTGRPSDRWGSEVVAVVQLVEGAEPDEEGLLAEAANHVARYKLPKAFVFVDSLVRSPAGKADYRWAKARAEAAKG